VLAAFWRSESANMTHICDPNDFSKQQDSVFLSSEVDSGLLIRQLEIHELLLLSSEVEPS
jgi:hypothetical protein